MLLGRRDSTSPTPLGEAADEEEARGEEPMEGWGSTWSFVRSATVGARREAVAGVALLREVEEAEEVEPAAALEVRGDGCSAFISAAV